MPRVSKSTGTATRTPRTAVKTAAVRKMPAVKKAVAKKAPTKRVVKRVKPELQVTPVKYTFTKSTLNLELCERTGLDKKTVQSVMDSLEAVILGTVHPKGVGQFTLPGLMKVTTKKVPARKGGQKKVSPLTGLEYITKAKPATVRVRIRTGSKLKQAAVL